MVELLEDEGIEADHYYRMTRNDLLLDNVDLIAFACKLLEPHLGPVSYALDWRTNHLP